MHTKHGIKRLPLAVACCALAGLMVGCSVAGPNAIHSGRMAYNRAIAETNAQQMLMVPVHNRYEEVNHLLSVASVTANVRVSGRAGVQAGFGSSSTYDGNLVPFSGGFLYEENPTISYRPVTGEAYLAQLMSPVPLSVMTQITRVLPDPGLAYAMLLASINGIHNPAFLYGEQQDDPRFDRLVALFTHLTRDNRLFWVSEPGDTDEISLLLMNPDADPQISELLNLLGLPADMAKAPRVVIPAAMTLYSSNDAGLSITTRSIWELVEILTAAVQVPAGDEASGLATEFPPLARAGRELRIAYAQRRPEQAYVSVEHREGWYYIDSTDQVTKRYFKILGSLWSAAISQSLDDVSASPVLTVPVSR